MKKFLLLLVAVGMIFTACEPANGLDENNNDNPTEQPGSNDQGGETPTPPPVEPTAKIATIEEQGANIKATLVHIETTKNALNNVLVSLKEQQPVTRGNDNGVKEQIANIEGQINALEDIIIRLTAYTGGELAEITDWANATFATLEQQEALAAELATLKATIAELDTVSTTELSDALAASEQSMKQWVNEQLAGYATIADVDAQIAALKVALTEESEAEHQEIEALIAELKTLQEETETSYKEAIASAIQNQGVINEQIAADIAAVNKRIDEELATINSRLDEIEARLDKIEEAIKDLVNRIQSVSLVKRGNDAIKIVTSAESASVTLNYEISPKSTIEGLALKWEEYVKVKALYDGEELVFVDMPITSFKADIGTGIVTVTVSGENLSAEFYTDLQAASLRMEISDGNNDKRSEYIPVTPQRWMVENISVIPANDELYYTSHDGNSIAPCFDESDFGAPLISNLYDWRKGCFVLKFDGDITKIGQLTFGVSDENIENAFATLKYFAMPNSVTAIGKNAFRWSGLVSIVIPDSVTRIYDGAFGACQNLTSVHLGSGVTNLGTYLFSRCLKLEDVNIPEKITEIPNNCFNECESLKSISLPDSVIGIGSNAFSECKNLKDIEFSNCLETIGNGAFASCRKVEISSFPQTLKSIGNSAFYNCDAIKTITLPESVSELGEAPFWQCGRLEYFYGKFASEDNRCLVVNNELICTSHLISGEYKIPEGITRLKSKSITYLSKPVTLEFPSSITEIEGYAFTGLGNVQGFKGALASKDGKLLILGDTLYAVAAYELEECVVPEGVKYVAYRVFNRIDTLKSLTLPSTLEEVGYKFVDYCKELQSVFFKSTTPPLYNSKDKGIFFGMEGVQYNIYVPLNSVPAYKAADGWKDYADKIQGIVL